MTSKNQITLPVKVLRSLNIDTKARFEVVVNKKGNIELGPVRKNFRDWVGSLADHPISKKYSSVEIVELAKEMKAEKEKRQWGL